MQRRSFSWMALVGIGLAGVVAVSAATALAARTAASPFEIVAIDRYGPSGLIGPSTFTSGAPFCESGTVVFLESQRRGETDLRYTCSDGSGSLTLAVRVVGVGGTSEWTIVEGSGGYAGLRGKGSYRSELLSEEPVYVSRTTLQGFAAEDAVAPSVAFTSASATKLRGSGGWYTISVVLSLRDDVEGNTVAYTLRVREGPEHPRDRRRPELASTTGTTASRLVNVFPSSKRVRSVQLLLSDSDPVGNEVSIVRWLKLPR